MKMQRKSQREGKLISKRLCTFVPNLPISYLESSFLTAHAGLRKRGFPTAGQKDRTNEGANRREKYSFLEKKKKKIAAAKKTYLRLKTAFFGGNLAVKQ